MRSSCWVFLATTLTPVRIPHNIEMTSRFMPYTVVIFGASGDLTSRKLIPALYRLHLKGRLPEATRIVGMARSEFTHTAWRDQLQRTTAEHSGTEFDAEGWRQFAE